MRTFLDRLFPERLRQRKEMSGEARLALWAHVTDNDLCLRALVDMFDDLIEASAIVLLHPDTPPAQQEVARARLSVMRQLLRQIEDERAAAQQGRISLSPS